MRTATRAFGALALGSLVLIAGCFEEPDKLPPAATVSPTETLNAVSMRDELISLHPYFVGKGEVKSRVVGLEGCQLFGISAAESAYHEKKSTVICTTQDNRLAGKFVCLPTGSGGGCLPDGHVAAIRPSAP